MKKSEKMTELEVLAASQWGLFTTAQARELGIQRNQISRMVDSLRVEPVCYGVYRFIAGEESPLSDVKAAWLSAYPKETAAARFSTKPYDAVVAGRTAAHALGAGDFQPSPYTFIVDRRKQTSRDAIRFLQCKLDEEDVILDAEVPTTSFERTVYDLLRLDEDPDNVDKFMQDAARKKGHTFDRERLGSLLTPIAARYGFNQGDGLSFAEDLIARNTAPIQISKASETLNHALGSFVNQNAMQKVLQSSAPFIELQEKMRSITANMPQIDIPAMAQLRKTQSVMSALSPSIVDLKPSALALLQSIPQLNLPLMPWADADMNLPLSASGDDDGGEGKSEGGASEIQE